MNHLSITLKSLLNRKTSFFLTVLLIALSTFLILTIERIRLGARDSFQNTISKVDLVVGARSSPLNLILYSVFRIGDPTNNVSFDSYKNFSQKKEVSFAIPISLGDSHKGFRVVGTNENYFKFYKFSGGKNLTFFEGDIFKNTLDAVIGYEVAQKLKYSIGDKIILSHGTGDLSNDHEGQYFKIVGILNKTNTPVDQSVHVSLEAIEAIHVGWEKGFPSKDKVLDANKISSLKFEPKSITAFFLGLNSRRDVFNMQREINDFSEEPLTGALPGVVLTDLWKSLGFIENILKILSLIVFFSSLASLFLVLISSLNNRRREMAIFRSLGARPTFIFSLFLIESFLISLVGIVVGYCSTILSVLVAIPLIEKQFSFNISTHFFVISDIYYISAILLVSILVGIIPAIVAFKRSLTDGLMVRT